MQLAQVRGKCREQCSGCSITYDQASCSVPAASAARELVTEMTGTVATTGALIPLMVAAAGPLETMLFLIAKFRLDVAGIIVEVATCLEGAGAGRCPPPFCLKSQASHLLDLCAIHVLQTALIRRSCPSVQPPRARLVCGPITDFARGCTASRWPTQQVSGRTSTPRRG